MCYLHMRFWVKDLGERGGVAVGCCIRHDVDPRALPTTWAVRVSTGAGRCEGQWSANCGRKKEQFSGQKKDACTMATSPALPGEARICTGPWKGVSGRQVLEDKGQQDGTNHTEKPTRALRTLTQPEGTQEENWRRTPRHPQSLGKRPDPAVRPARGSVGDGQSAKT